MNGRREVPLWLLALLAAALVAAVAVVLSAIARAFAADPAVAVDVAVLALFRVELLDRAGGLLETWCADEEHAEGWGDAQRRAHAGAHPDCSVRLVPLPPYTPMVTPGGEPR